jgi:hypothetical protein
MNLSAIEAVIEEQKAGVFQLPTFMQSDDVGIGGQDCAISVRLRFANHRARYCSW